MVVIFFPKEIEEDWGKDKVAAFVEWLEAFIKEKLALRDKQREILTRLNLIENTLEHMEKEQSEQHRSIESLAGQIKEQLDKISERLDTMTSR
jgi:predicted nuclease with TOPRIM domain